MEKTWTIKFEKKKKRRKYSYGENLNNQIWKKRRKNLYGENLNNQIWKKKKKIKKTGTGKIWTTKLKNQACFLF